VRSYDALFQAASETLLELGQDRLDGLLGLTAVLHTWTRELRFHSDVHLLVTAGVLASTVHLSRARELLAGTSCSDQAPSAAPLPSMCRAPRSDRRRSSASRSCSAGGGRLMPIANDSLLGAASSDATASSILGAMSAPTSTPIPTPLMRMARSRNVVGTLSKLFRAATATCQAHGGALAYLAAGVESP
jgi:hypothetical protein